MLSAPSKLPAGIAAGLDQAEAIVANMRAVVGDKVTQPNGEEPGLELLKLDLQFAAHWLARARATLEEKCV